MYSHCAIAHTAFRQYITLAQVAANCSSGVVDAQQQCCPSGVLDINVTCCEVGSALDGAGWCCPVGTLDSCGVCNGAGKAVDVEGTCCNSTIDAAGVCCQVVRHSCPALYVQRLWCVQRGQAIQREGKISARLFTRPYAFYKRICCYRVSKHVTAEMVNAESTTREASCATCVCSQNPVAAYHACLSRAMHARCRLWDSIHNSNASLLSLL